MTTVQSLYAQLLRNPADPAVMQVLADALEEAGHTDVSAAYRWAARNHKWPFIRHEWCPRYRKTTSGAWERMNGNRIRPVYDWDTDRRPPGGSGEPVEERSRLPRPLYQAIAHRPKKNNVLEYGGVHRAFKLLAKALKGNPEYLKES